MSHLKKRIDAAQGKIPCDVLLRGAEVLDVFSCEWRKLDLAWIDGVIVGADPDLSGLSAKEEIKAGGLSVVPGFIDAHVHVESSMMVPTEFERAVLSRGTTSAVCDPHELTNVLGLSGLQYFLDSSEKLSMDLWVMLSSCVPATHLETNGGGAIGAEPLKDLSSHSRALGLAEMMNMPGVLLGLPEVLEKLDAFSGSGPTSIIDGHCPLLRGQGLSAYAATGISSCHESSELDEAAEKLRKGISVWIREGSVAKDLKTLTPLLNLSTSTSIGFCTDDRNPFDIEQEGHIDYLVRGSIRGGVASEVAYRSASWSVARHYGLDRLRGGRGRVGALAPGYQADLILLEDRDAVAVKQVFKNGVLSDRLSSEKVPTDAGNTIRTVLPSAEDMTGPAGSVHVIEVLEGKIITERSVAESNAAGVSRLSVLERYGKGGKPANAYVRGFGELTGAIASSVGHDSHNLIVVGQDPEDMRTALASLIEVGGGFSVAKDGKTLACLPLSFGGLMSEKDPKTLSSAIRELKSASTAIGCQLTEPFLQLAFLSLPVIPSLKLTDLGLVDVEKFDFIDVRAS